MALPKTGFLDLARQMQENKGKSYSGIPADETLSQSFMRAYRSQTVDDDAGTNKSYPDSEKYANWSDEDLQFIIDNVESFGKYDLVMLWKFAKKNAEFGSTEVGLYWAIKNGVKSPLLTKAAFLVAGFLASQHTVGDPLYHYSQAPGGTMATEVERKFYPRGEEFTVDYFIDNLKDIFPVVAIENYTFEIFDLKLTELVNLYLSGSPNVLGLNFAQSTVSMFDALFGDVEDEVYVWPPDFGTDVKTDAISIKNVQTLVDNSLYLQRGESLETKAINYSRPFRVNKRFVNDVKLDPSVGFSRFKVSTAYNVNPGYFFDSIKFVNSSKTAWFDFVFAAFGSRTTKTDGKWRFSSADLDATFKDAANNLLNTKVTVPIYVYLKGVSGNKEIELNYFERTAKSILDVFRKAAWYNYIKEMSDPDFDPDTANPYDLLDKAFKAGETAAKEGEETTGQPPPDREKPLTDQEIEERQRFMKQCALMTRLGDLAQEHTGIINKRVKNKDKSDANGIYNRRFYLVKDGTSGDQGGIITKILLPKAGDIKEFLDLKPAVHAFLTPKLRFYKVSKGSAVKELEEIEFKFRNFTSRSRIAQLLTPDRFDRGGDYGIKQFSFSFEGATPATARNDIKAKLSLFFQSFEDFIEKRDGNKFPFVDMLLLPSGVSKKGSGAASSLQYSPKYYRLRVDVGWEIKSIEDVKKMPGVDYESLQTALEKTNKSFYLNMIDHTINFNDDGSVQIDVDYRAYIETSLKGSSLDALSSHKVRKSLKNARETYKKLLQSGKCSPKQLNDIRRQLLQLEDLLKKQTFQSIMERMIKNNFIFFKKISTKSENNFQKTGFFRRPVSFAGDGKPPTASTSKKEAASSGGDATFESGGDFFKESLSNDEDFNFINYFYLGDLLYVILDSLYTESNPAKYVEGFEKFKFILGSFEYSDIFDNAKPNKTINLASIPISVELFFEWFSENVIKQDRNSYPIMFFIRDLCTYLIGEILTENCFKSSLDKKLQFHTTNFVGIGDPFSSMKGPIINLKDQYKKGTLPLKQDSKNHVSIDKMTNYVAIYVDAPKITITKDIKGFKRGNPGPDGEGGIYHFQIGKDRGLLKKLKFSKTDMKYVREARFFRHGFDGLMQLSNVYSVSLDMVGNTLYYPGMEIFVNPLGFLGAKNSSYNPTIPGSVANKLGFGGYHLVTKVNSTIEPGNFTTTVDAMYTYAGDGDASSTTYGKADEVKSGTSKIDATGLSDAGRSPSCSAAYDQIVNQALDIVDGKDSFEKIDFDFSREESPSATEATEDDVTETSTTTDSVITPDATVPTADDIPGVETPTESVGLNILDVTKPAVKAYDQVDKIDGRKYYLDGDSRIYEDGTTISDSTAKLLGK